VIPAKNEDLTINELISTLVRTLKYSFEIIVVVEDLNDSTVKAINSKFKNESFVKVFVNENITGAGGSIKTGVEKSNGKVVVITMADLSDDISDINVMTELVLSGNDIVVASRYALGGKSINAPFLKSMLSRYAGILLRIFTKVNTTDPTNAFKAYSKNFISRYPIESTSGFTIGLELIGKGLLENAQIAEIPTIWVERKSGKTNFKIMNWFFIYVYWFLRCIRNKYANNIS
jgi:dolichol-phosphate mannosyltransferase